MCVTLQAVGEASLPLVALCCQRGIVAVVAVTQVELMHEIESEVACDVDIEPQSVEEYGLFAFISPRIDAICHFLLVQVWIFLIFEQILWCLALEDEKSHEVHLVAEGKAAVVDELEAVAQREACAEVVAAHGVVVGCAASEWHG